MVLIRNDAGEPVCSTPVEIVPRIEYSEMWRAGRAGSTDQDGMLTVDCIVSGLANIVRDRRFDRSVGRLAEAWERWVDAETIFIPLGGQ